VGSLGESVAVVQLKRRCEKMRHRRVTRSFNRAHRPPAPPQHHLSTTTTTQCKCPSACTHPRVILHVEHTPASMHVCDGWSRLLPDDTYSPHLFRLNDGSRYQGTKTLTRHRTSFLSPRTLTSHSCSYHSSKHTLTSTKHPPVSAPLTMRKATATSAAS
jgi:hypothetical protein